jgi:hypothetical protein
VVDDTPDPTAGWWAQDPTGRFPQRWWDGSRWSEKVRLDHGVEAIDPAEIGAKPPPGAVHVAPSQQTSVFTADPLTPTPSPSLHRIWRPAASPLTFAALGAGFLLLAIGLFGLRWIDTTTDDPEASFECTGAAISGEPDPSCDDPEQVAFTMSLPELRETFDEIQDVTGERSGFSAVSKWYLDGGNGLMLGVLVVLALLCAVRVLPWVAVAAGAVVGLIWHLWFVFELVDETGDDWGVLGIGPWVVAGALIGVAFAAILAQDPDLDDE